MSLVVKGYIPGLYEGKTTADGAFDGSSLIAAGLTTKPDYDGNLVIITSGAYTGQGRDINGATIGGTVTPSKAFDGQILTDTKFAIIGIRTVPAEVAALTALVTALMTHVGDPTGETLPSLAAKWGDIARSLDLILGARWDGGSDLGTDILAIINAIAAIPTTPTLQATWTDALATALSAYTAVRAGYLDQLDFALQEAIATLQTDLNNPDQYKADLTTLESRLSAIRAGYLDQLDFNLQEAIAAIPTTPALQATWTDALATALAAYTTVRAGYLDQLDFGLQEAIAAIETKLDTPANFMADLTTLETRLSAARALLLDEITALRMAELDAVNIPADIDTLLTRITAAVALASVCTEVRLAELNAANLPADIDTLLTRITAAVALAADLATHEASQVTHRAVLVDIHDTDLPAVKAETALIKAQTDKIAGKMLFSMDFWSLPQEEVAVTGVAGDKGLPSVVVAEIPDGATIVRAIAMFKFRMIESHTYAGENSLSGAQEIQVMESVAGAWVDAINFVDTQFTLAQDTREGGDIIIGAIDVSAVEVDDNGTYDFQWDEAVAQQDGIKFNDIQMGIRIWYSV